MWIPWTLNFHTNLLPSEQNQKLIALIHSFLSKAYCLDSTTKKWNPVQILLGIPSWERSHNIPQPKRNFESIKFPNFFHWWDIVSVPWRVSHSVHWITSSRWLPEPPGSERRWVSAGSSIEGWSRRILRVEFRWWDDGTVGLITARLVSFLGWLVLQVGYTPEN